MSMFKMWWKAITIMPRMSKAEFQSLDVIAKWLISTRAAVFLLTVFSALIGGILAIKTPDFSLTNFIVCTLGLVFAHATNNLLNDYSDHKRGIDKDNYYRSMYGPQVMEHGLMSKAVFFRYVAVSFAIALLCGGYLIYTIGLPVLWLMLAGLVFLLFYTWPLKYIGMGEPTVLLVWGPLMVGGTYLVSSGGLWSWEIVLISIAYAIGPLNVLFGKHIDKSEQDRAKKVYTLPVLLGEKKARMTAIVLWILQIALTIYIATEYQLYPMMIIILALPKLISTIKIFSKPRPTEAPEDLPKNTWPLYLSAYAFVYNKTAGGLFFLGIIFSVIFFMEAL